MIDDSMKAMLEVQPAALFTFAGAVMEAQTKWMPELNKAMLAIASLDYGFAPVPSAALTMVKIGGTIDQTGQFQVDMGKGSAAFMAGAQTIAVNYVVSDDAALDEMSDVQAAFDVANVPDGQQTVTQAYEADAEAAEREIGAIAPVQLPDPNDLTPDNTEGPEDTPAEKAAQQSADWAEFDENTNNNNGREDNYPPHNAPIELIIEMNNADENTRRLDVIDAQGNHTTIPNPIYVPPVMGYYGG